MSKKHKCKLCTESMLSFAYPQEIDETNCNYAKHCLSMIKNNLYCSYAMKVKNIEHEQYCKHFELRDNEMIDFYFNYRQDVIHKLENMIREYESSFIYEE